MWIAHLIPALTFILTHIQNPLNHCRAFHLPRMSSGQFSAGGPRRDGGIKKKWRNTLILIRQVQASGVGGGRGEKKKIDGERIFPPTRAAANFTFTN